MSSSSGPEAARRDPAAATTAPPGGRRRRVYEILEHAGPERDPASRACDLALIALILLNAAAVVLASVEPLFRAYWRWFLAFEVFSIAVFTAEYGLRLWSCVEDERYRRHGPVAGRLRYALTPLALVDLLAILPFYLGFVLGADLRFLRVLRLVRLLKLTRYSPALALLGQVLREEAGPILAALFVLSLVLVVGSGLAYLAEHAAQPDAFGNMLDAMWWAVVTMTTVGYGDVTPVTPLGKVIAACLGVLGIGMVALPAGFLASGFSEQIHRRRREYEDAVARALADGVITDRERDELEDIRASLGLSRAQADAVLAREEERSRRTVWVRPHRGNPLAGGAPWHHRRH